MDEAQTTLDGRRTDALCAMRLVAWNASYGFRVL
jgi:hypothetical protein